MLIDYYKRPLRIFSPGDQLAFAQLSGDVNPLHMDPVYARRTQLGAAAVHGVHATLWALEELAQAGFLPDLPRALRVRFLRPLIVGEEATLDTTPRKSGGVRFQISSNGATSIIGEASLQGGDLADRLERSSACEQWPSHLQTPAEVDLRDSEGMYGAIDLTARPKLLNALFPTLLALGGAEFIQGLAGLSYLVGMISPGLHSIFGSIDCAFSSEPLHDLRFETRSVDPRFRRIIQRVDAGSIVGTIESFFRPPPVEGESLEQIFSFVEPGDFEGVRALVIGGSRGLGATAAKILLAGGARVTITYLRGEAEANAMGREASKLGCVLKAIKFDATSTDTASLFDMGENYNSLYYFATPKIVTTNASYGISKPALGNFLEFYVAAFDRIVRALELNQSGAIYAFYPSTQFIDDNILSFQEYCLAKIAGEAVCRIRALSNPRLRVVAPRLPKILTDQTASISGGIMANGALTLIPLLKSLHEKDRVQ